MANVSIKFNSIRSNSRFGSSWKDVKASDTFPFSHYAKQSFKLVITIALIPFKSLYSAGKAILGHRVAQGQWSRSQESSDTLWTRVKDTVSPSWKKENE